MPASLPQCSVIIPVYNKWELTRTCLTSLREQSAGHDLEVIVADNGSTDATRTELRPLGESLFKDRFKALVFPENINFGPACNAGARDATSRVLFFLNNDTVLTPGWFPPLYEGLGASATVGAVGPLLLYENNTVQHLGVAFGTVGPLHLYRDFPADHPVVARKRNLQCITGAALMLSRNDFWDCGGFYEKYRNGFEDVDLCIQLKERGKTLACIPESRVYHLESQTPGRKGGEEYNTAILTERCGKKVFIDVHILAMKDKFSFFIDDLLSISICLQEKDEEQLTAEASGKDALAWLELTRKNPLWVRGREVLANSLEKAGRQADAVIYRVELAGIQPTVRRFRDLLRLAPYAGEAPWLETVKKRLTLAGLFMSDRAAAKNSVRAIRKRLRPGGDPLLEKAFDAKLREMFPGS